MPVEFCFDVPNERRHIIVVVQSIANDCKETTGFCHGTTEIPFSFFYSICLWYYPHHSQKKTCRVSLFISGSMWRAINERQIIGLKGIMTMTGTDGR